MKRDKKERLLFQEARDEIGKKRNLLSCYARIAYFLDGYKSPLSEVNPKHKFALNGSSQSRISPVSLLSPNSLKLLYSVEIYRVPRQSDIIIVPCMGYIQRSPPN